jgi:hypothetical protein
VAAVALPFILAGAFTVRQGLSQLGRDEGAWFLIGFGSLFAIVGVVFIAGASYSMRHVSHDLAMREQSPDKPWLWRKDWTEGYAREISGSGAVIAIWIFTIVWSAISMPLLLVFRQEYQRGNSKVLFVGIFPAIGVILVLVALYMTFRRRRYGTTLCHFDGAPLVLGHTVRGDVELHGDITPENGYVVRLACVHAVTTSGRRNNSTRETVMWDDEQVVSASAAMRSPVATRVPFQFVTPPDAPTTDTRNNRDRTYWRLSVTAEVPGIDLDTSFELPLFAIGGLSDGSEFASYAAAHRAGAAERHLRSDSGVAISDTPEGGEEYVIRTKPTFGGVIAALLFFSLWSGAIYLMIRLQAPVFFPIIFGIFDVFIFLGLLDYLFGRSVIRANREGLSYRRSTFGGGSFKNVAAADVAAVTGNADSQNANFSVIVKLRDGSTSDLARFLRSRADADTVAARIEKALGR